MTTFIKSCCFAVIVVIVVMSYATYYGWLQRLRKTSSSAGEALCKNYRFIDFDIYHCKTGKVIGTRPSVHLVPYNDCKYHKKPENKENRKASFQNIFDKRIWGGNKGAQWTAVSLLASGNFFFL